MLHAVIMAGGSGTRFWPASRAAHPKQLLDLAGQRTMIQSTVARLGSLVSANRVLVVTNKRLVDAVRQQLPELPDDSVLGEPCKRDTAPCVGLAAAWVCRDDPNATMVVLPADHVIESDEVFQQAITQASEMVDAEPQRLVTFGIRPSYAAESFGYIERGEKLPASGTAPAFRVKQFREKPKAEVARQYVDSGTFYWNSGIFVWKARTILNLLAEHEPQMHRHIENIANAIKTPQFRDVFETEFAAIAGKSIDYAVMERASDVAVIEAPFSWDDVGSWQSLARLRGTDDDGNTVDGRSVVVHTQGTIIRGSQDHLIATVGLKDCIIVHTPNATLVANKHDEESIREIVKLLEDKGWTDYL